MSAAVMGAGGPAVTAPQSRWKPPPWATLSRHFSHSLQCGTSGRAIAPASLLEWRTGPAEHKQKREVLSVDYIRGGGVGQSQTVKKPGKNALRGVAGASRRYKGPADLHPADQRATQSEKPDYLSLRL